MNPSRLLVLGLVLLLSGSVFGMENEYEQYDSVDAENNYVKDSGEHSYELIPASFGKALGILGGKEDGTTNDAPGVAKNLPEGGQNRSSLKQFLKHGITIALFGLIICFVGSFAKGAIKVSLKVLIIVGFCLFLACTLGWISPEQVAKTKTAFVKHTDDVVAHPGKYMDMAKSEILKTGVAVYGHGLDFVDKYTEEPLESFVESMLPQSISADNVHENSA
eukprot:500619_1